MNDQAEENEVNSEHRNKIRKCLDDSKLVEFYFVGVTSDDDVISIGKGSPAFHALVSVLAARHVKV